MIEEMTAIQADELIEKIAAQKKIIAAQEARRDEFIAHFQQKIERAQYICDKATAEARREITLLTETLRQYAATNLPEDRKSIALPSGKLKFHSQAPKFYFANGEEVSGSDERLLAFAKKNAPEFVKTKTVEVTDWAAIKKGLSFDGQDVYLYDGQQLEGVHAHFFRDKFTVETL